MNRQSDHAKLINLQDGQQCTIFWSEEQGGIVHRNGKLYHLYEASWGGEHLAGIYTQDQFNALLDEAYSWT